MSLTRRAAAAARYRPARVRLLLVAEAPPCTPDRYFYFEDVDRHDWLFRYVWEGLTGRKPERSDKRHHLAALRDAGVFLIDLHEESISPSVPQLIPMVPGLLQRCRALNPDRIVLIKSSVYDAAFESLSAARLPVADARIPSPPAASRRGSWTLSGAQPATSRSRPLAQAGRHRHAMLAQCPKRGGSGK